MKTLKTLNLIGGAIFLIAGISSLLFNINPPAAVSLVGVGLFNIACSFINEA